MKNILYLFACILFSCHSDRVQESKPISVPSNIAEIKSAYAATIQKLTTHTLDSVTKQYNCNEERSGTVTYYLQDHQLTLIKHVYAEYSHHEATDMYFVKDSTLYFAHFKRLNWSFESGAASEGATKDDITENRFYIIAGDVVQCLEKKYTLHSAFPNRSIAEQTPNKKVTCEPAPLMKAFNDLTSFRMQKSYNCLEK